jgi:hypothetical protein
MENARTKMDVIRNAAWFAWHFINLHPFKDGNGRVSRIILERLLTHHNIPNPIIYPWGEDVYVPLNIYQEIIIDSVLISIGFHQQLENSLINKIPYTYVNSHIFTPSFMKNYIRGEIERSKIGARDLLRASWLIPFPTVNYLTTHFIEEIDVRRDIYAQGNLLFSKAKFEAKNEESHKNWESFDAKLSDFLKLPEKEASHYIASYSFTLKTLPKEKAMDSPTMIRFLDRKIQELNQIKTPPKEERDRFDFLSPAFYARTIQESLDTETTFDRNDFLPCIPIFYEMGSKFINYMKSLKPFELGVNLNFEVSERLKKIYRDEHCPYFKYYQFQMFIDNIVAGKDKDRFNLLSDFIESTEGFGKDLFLSDPLKRYYLYVHPYLEKPLPFYRKLVLNFWEFAAILLYTMEVPKVMIDDQLPTYMRIYNVFSRSPTYIRRPKTPQRYNRDFEIGVIIAQGLEKLRVKLKKPIPVYSGQGCNKTYVETSSARAKREAKINYFVTPAVISASEDINVAKNFWTRDKCLFQFNMKNSYPIYEFSAFEFEREILLPPFVPFKHVKTMERIFPGNEKIKVFVLEEVDPPKNQWNFYNAFYPRKIELPKKYRFIRPWEMKKEK